MNEIASLIDAFGRPAGRQQLKDVMVNLLADRDRQQAISQAALEHAPCHSFARVADAYLDDLGLL